MYAIHWQVRNECIATPPFFCLAISKVVSVRDILVRVGEMAVHVAKNKKELELELDSCHRRFEPSVLE
jgi:hypothetical protein